MENNNNNKKEHHDPITILFPRHAVPVSHKVELNEKERKTFDVLLQVTKQFKLGTTMRVAGGWVRDKLLAQHSDDIDIALDNIMGQQFAEKVNEYLKLIGEEVHSIGVIHSNPEQSKHLETATMRVLGTWIDFVNLRTEEYSDSRIPVIKIGTAEEDAFRRDLTINALFYNINEDKVEDFTKNGISDLEKGIVRTPLAPLTTFLDDPLRVLRAIRFSSRMSFGMEPSLISAASSEEVKEALRKKISKERIGKELKGMFNRNPIDALILIHDIGIADIVFELPKSLNSISKEYSQTIKESLMNAAQINRFLKQDKEFVVKDIVSKEDIKHMILGAYSVPYLEYEYTVKKRIEPVIKYIFGESIKWPTKEVDTIYLLAKSAVEIKHLVENKELNRVNIGIQLRKTGPLWKLAATIALCLDLPPFTKVDLKEILPDNATITIDKYTHFKNKVYEYNLDGVWDMKPLFDGNEMITQFKFSPGPILSQLKDKMIEWQLDNPNLGKAECAQYIRDINIQEQEQPSKKNKNST